MLIHQSWGESPSDLFKALIPILINEMLCFSSEIFISTYLKKKQTFFETRSVLLGRRSTGEKLYSMIFGSRNLLCSYSSKTEYHKCSFHQNVSKARFYGVKVTELVFKEHLHEEIVIQVLH